MVSGIITALLLGLFLFGTVWAFSPKRKREFDAAAALPLHEDARRADEAAEETPQ
jgi:cytochrome c oxidase cbb3-type subunit 4